MNTRKIVDTYFEGVRDAIAGRPSRAKQYTGSAKTAYMNGYKNRG